MALPENPITRDEQYLSNIAGEETELPDYPITRKEKYLAAIAGENVVLPEYPIDREEKYLAYIAENGGGGDITVEPLTVTENGTYDPGSGKAYKPVTVNVPEPVIEPLSVTENGTYTAEEGVDGYSPITVNVPSGAATQEELDAIAGLVGGITTPSTPADIEAQAGDLIDDANTATGESDTNLTDAVASLIAGQGGGFLRETGRISLHTGSNTYQIKIPVSDTTKSHYMFSVKAINTWDKVDGVWVENDGLVFAASKASSTSLSLTLAGMSAYPIEVNDAIAGETINDGGTFTCFVCVDHDFSHSTLIREVNNLTVTIGTGEITLKISGYKPFCRNDIGLTHEFTVVGWD